MTNDHYQRLRDALAAGPTPGSWEYRELDGLGAVTHPTGWVEAVHASDARECIDARYIAAADPDTIRTLLAERDALREALVIARDYVADEIAYLKNAFRGHEELGRVPEAEADLARIDAALESTNAHP